MRASLVVVLLPALACAACEYTIHGPVLGYETDEESCVNTFDDDGDGAVDCEDPECWVFTNRCGEFFTEEVICEGARIRILVNGQQTVDFTDAYDHPKRQAGFKTGHIAVQAHDPKSVMTFQSVEIKRLTPAK